VRTRGVTLIGPCPPPAGGIASHVADLAAWLCEQGVPSRVVVPRRSLGFLGQLARPPGWVTHAHVHGHSVRAWLLASACAGVSRAILTVHSGLAPAYLHAHPRVVRMACARYAAVIAVSDAIAEALVAAGVARRRVVVAPAFLPGALAERVPPAGLMQVRRCHCPLLVAAAAPGPEYGVDLALSGFAELLRQHPQAALVLIGPGLRRRELLRRNVYLFGELARAEALGLLAAADVVLRPSRADGDSITVREALALGVPVVASDAARRPPGVIVHASGSVPALARAIDQAWRARPTALPPGDAQAALAALYRRLGVAIAAPPKEAPCAVSSAA
jgi:glycosyltransferase involved in cell wall biosynthesis